MTTITKSTDETYAFARKIAETLSPGDIVTLQGDLGSGKTTFTQALGRALGVKKRITSPSFLVMKTYTIDKGIIKRLNHIDLYRIENEQDIKIMGLEDFMSDPEAITIIEWPEKMGSLLPQRRIALEFEYVDENTRKIAIK